MTSPATRARFAALLAAAAVTLSAVLSPALATTVSLSAPGYDVSWPECSVADGMSNPMPAGQHRFMIVGVSDGAGFGANPCLAQQWKYANNHTDFASAYALPIYPTPSRLKRAKTGHYGTCTTLHCRLKNSGWSQGHAVDVRLRTIGAHPALVWLDVEPRTGQPWSSKTAKNARVIKAETASLRSAGYRVGIYSNDALWRQVAGYRTTLPEWTYGGSLSRGCRMPFSAGRVWVSQDWVTTRKGEVDTDAMCGAAPRLPKVFQRAHPTVRTARTSDGIAAMRYSQGPLFQLNRRVGSRPSIVRLNTSDGFVPLFVAVTPTGHLYARTLGAGWVALGTCSAAPGVTAHGGKVWVACRDATGALSVVTVSVNSDGVPTGAKTAIYPASLVGSPRAAYRNGGPVFTGRFTDESIRHRTLSTGWSVLASTTLPSRPTSAVLAP